MLSMATRSADDRNVDGHELLRLSLLLTGTFGKKPYPNAFSRPVLPNVKYAKTSAAGYPLSATHGNGFGPHRTIDYIIVKASITASTQKFLPLQD